MLTFLKSGRTAIIGFTLGWVLGCGYGSMVATIIRDIGPAAFMALGRGL